MAVRFPSYLHRNRCGVFGFRVVVPRRVRHAFSFSEHRLSLLTPRLSEAKVLAYSLGSHVRKRLALIGSMSEDQAKASAEAFIRDLATERDRIAAEFQSVSDERSKTDEQIAAASELLRELLSAQGDPESGLAAQVHIPAVLSQRMGRTEDDGHPTSFELALDSLNGEVQRLAYERADQDRQLAVLAGQSTELVRSYQNHVNWPPE